MMNAPPVASLNRGLWLASMTIFTIHLTGPPSYKVLIHGQGARRRIDEPDSELLLIRPASRIDACARLAQNHRHCRPTSEMVSIIRKWTRSSSHFSDSYLQHRDQCQAAASVGILIGGDERQSNEIGDFGHGDRSISIV